jgi:hypothetical protein
MIPNNIKSENNADLVIRELRELQQMVFSFDVSDKDIFNRITKIISTAELASKEIRTNYEEVSKGLTDLMNGKNRRTSENS